MIFYAACHIISYQMRIYVVVITAIKLSTYICINVPMLTHTHMYHVPCATPLHNKISVCVLNLRLFSIQKLMLLLPHSLPLLLLLLLLLLL